MLKRLWREDEGVLTFEWILLLTLLVIGIIGGLAAVRDAIIVELYNVGQAMIHLDQGYDVLGPYSVGFGDCTASSARPMTFNSATNGSIVARATTSGSQLGLSCGTGGGGGPGGGSI
ncbi:MAG: hypothetical protein ABSG68_27230 [Thermoguttaceae bacterium]|jgi:Flp pilus assembly pilin Flp